jgi:hypothetical protein
MVVGATTPDGATFVAKVDGGGPVRVAVADNENMTSPVFTSSQAVDAQGVAKVSITGLDPDTAYWWQVEDNSTLDTSVTGRLRTHPLLNLPASFTIAAASCAGLNSAFPGDGSELADNRLSNHPVFDTIRGQDPLMFVHLGDLHYYDLGSDNHGIVGGGSLANYRSGYDDVLNQDRQHQIYREVAWSYIWDDHDFGPNDSDGTHVDKANAATVYRERVPHYPLDDANGIWQEWQIGRVQFIASDARYYRDPNSDPQGSTKTMLGSAQKTWMEDVLTNSTAKVLVWFMSSQWIHPSGSDTWASFVHERDELVEMLRDTGWLGRMVMVYGDRHALGLTGGLKNSWGSFPILQAASLDSSFGGSSSSLFDIGTDTPGRDQYGTVSVTDLGNLITVKLTGWQGSSEWGSYTFGISTGSGSPILPIDISNTLAGSHRAVFEARVLEDFQTGSDPVGVTIPIMDGDVMFDGSAGSEFFASSEIQTAATDESTGRDLFPRRASDLLSPYGNEFFVRRGIDFGNEIKWFPLGYFRINDAEQDDDPDQPIRLTGTDRMAGIIDSRLLEPVQFLKDKTITSVVSELVHDVYPDALILFDDSSGSNKLGRQLVVEESRHAALLDIANSLGKVIYWDGEGFLRIEDPPDTSVVKWHIRAIRDGVLTESSRRVTRDGMANAVVATGEGSTEEAVRGLALDVGPNSPTRWGGKFGKVPLFYSSPLLTTAVQARKAARTLLFQRIGKPYSVDFGVIPNPSIRPRDTVRITQKNGEREKHIIETCTLPLVAGRNMTGTTREQTTVEIEES